MTQHSQITRRDMLRKGTLVGAVVWATPVVQTIGMSRAMAAEPSPDDLLIFFDDFSQEEAEELSYNSFQHWNVSDGTVDLLDPADVAKYGIPNELSSTNFVDLDGSTNNAGTMTTKQSFPLEPGDYVLTYYLAGNNRNSTTDMMTVLVQNGTILVDQIDSRPPESVFTPSVINFTIGAPISVQIVFNHQGGDNIGLLLDSVRLEKLP